jgi:hypothetical protein
MSEQQLQQQLQQTDETVNKTSSIPTIFTVEGLFL